jgi:hypothetical protein
MGELKKLFNLKQNALKNVKLELNLKQRTIPHNHAILGPAYFKKYFFINIRGDFILKSVKF